jgi:hypothetical protein
VARARRFENSPGVNGGPPDLSGNGRLAKSDETDAMLPLCFILESRPEEEMDTMPLEVWTAFVAIAAGGFLILLGYIISRWRK